MSKAMNEYFEALERLKQNKPINVQIGSSISNDTVALEAGRKRGSIKKSREMFYDLIEAIEDANKQNTEPKMKMKNLILKYKEESKKYKMLYEEALNRELMYLEKINELEKSIQNGKLYFKK